VVRATARTPDHAHPSLEDTARTNDILYPRCSAFLYEYHYGLPVHTNCHDMQAEAQREYGLTPDDVHDSFNFFMHTGIDRAGRPFIGRQMAKKGDYVELLALFDVLAVPNVCGADVMATSDFSFKPIALTIFESSEERSPRFPNSRKSARSARLRTSRSRPSKPIGRCGAIPIMCRSSPTSRSRRPSWAWPSMPKRRSCLSR
jgi:uncharacterized protein YcgI (DUF1989 family)